MPPGWGRRRTANTPRRSRRPCGRRGDLRYSARRAFTGSSRKARYAGTRVAINATKASVVATATSVRESDALTPKTSVFMTFADASAATVPAAMPANAGDIPSTITSRRMSALRAPSAVLIPISRLRPRTMVREDAEDPDRGEQQRDSGKEPEQQRAEALRCQPLVQHLHHRPDSCDRLLGIDRADRCSGRLCERVRRH